MNHVEISLQTLVDQAKLAGQVLSEHIKGVVLQGDRGASCIGSPALHIVLVAAIPLRQGMEGHRQLVVVDPPPRFARLFRQGRFDRCGGGGHAGRVASGCSFVLFVWVVSVLRIFVLGSFVCGVQRGIHLLLGHSCLLWIDLRGSAVPRYPLYRYSPCWPRLMMKPQDVTVFHLCTFAAFRSRTSEQFFCACFADPSGHHCTARHRERRQARCWPLCSLLPLVT